MSSFPNLIRPNLVFKLCPAIWGVKTRLVKKIIKDDFNDNPDVVEYIYFPNDSLKSELKITAQGDTVNRIEYSLFPDKKRITFERELIENFDSALIENKTLNTRRFDTLLYKYQFSYQGSNCQIEKLFDIRNNLLRETEYIYESGKLVKENHHIYLTDNKTFEKTRYYNYSKSLLSPDYYELNIEGDTILTLTNYFKKGVLVNLIEKDLESNSIYKVTYMNGKKVEVFIHDKNETYPLMMTEKFTYYENGDLKESQSIQVK